MWRFPLLTQGKQTHKDPDNAKVIFPAKMIHIIALKSAKKKIRTPEGGVLIGYREI